MPFCPVVYTSLLVLSDEANLQYMKKLFRIKKQRGFTLVELMIALAVTAILVSIAAPSFQTSIEKRRILTINDSYSAGLRLARSEAVARSRTITVCPSNDQSTCSGTWSDGWLIFIDDDKDRIFDFPDDELLKVGGDFAGGYTAVLHGDTTTTFQFNYEGRAVEQGTFSVCGPSAEANFAQGIIINLSGGTRYAIDSNSDGVRENHDGDNISC